MPKQSRVAPSAFAKVRTSLERMEPDLIKQLVPHDLLHAIVEGQLHITFDVFPRARDASYLLSRAMVEYGRERTTEGINQKLCELFRDALLLADADNAFDSVENIDHLSIILFHAGMGNETGLSMTFRPRTFLPKI